jgi:hypothetical protein
MTQSARHMRKLWPTYRWNQLRMFLSIVKYPNAASFSKMHDWLANRTSSAHNIYYNIPFVYLYDRFTGLCDVFEAHFLSSKARFQNSFEWCCCGSMRP